MASTPLERCPRCGGDFACGVAAGQSTCDCFSLALSDALRAQLAAQWPGQCLCLRCLRELSAAEAAAAPAAGRS